MACRESQGHLVQIFKARKHFVGEEERESDEKELMEKRS
jgi:hypothetical protein